MFMLRPLTIRSWNKTLKTSPSCLKTQTRRPIHIIVRAYSIFSK